MDVRVWTLGLLALGGSAASSTGFSYLAVQDHRLSAMNGLGVSITAPKAFRVLTPSSRRATFSGHPYEVSLGGFAARDRAVMIHAERVADSSGASNYDKLPISPMPGFHLRSQCAVIGAQDAREEHDLAWLKQRGWNPVGTLALEQHLISSADHNREVVVSFLVKVPSCSDTQATAARIDALRRAVQVSVEPNAAIGN